MGRLLSDIRSSARDILRDEFVEGVTSDFEDDELDRLIRLTLDEVEQKMPYEVKATAEDALSVVVAINLGALDALSTVATELSAVSTTLVVASDDDFPTTFPFYATIGTEIVLVTALASANTFTIGRGKKGSTAAIHLVGVSVGLSASATSLVVTTGDGADFPVSYPFYVTIEDEVVSVTAYPSADTFTITRGQKDSTAVAHTVGAAVGLTIVTTEDSKEIDLSGIADIIRVMRAEYQISRSSYNPKRYRNFEVFGDTLTMSINFLPSDGEEVHLYLHKKHTLTDATSTLKPDHETVLIQGVVARAAMNKGREQINALNVGGVNVGPRMVEWGREQLGLYRLALRQHTVKNPYIAYPKD